MIAQRRGTDIVLPGLASAHSHAFQRALRGRTQRSSHDAGSFWSWRGLMYELASKLTPESIYALSRFAFAELAMAGITAVGEFHYLHHQADGTPYENRTELAESVIRAAQSVGIRVTLLRVLYHRGGAGKAPLGAQTRFSDELDQGLGDVTSLSSKFAASEMVRIGVAPHSIRAVPRSWLSPVAQFATKNGFPLHMHVAEQVAEIEECLGEHASRPVAVLAEDGVLEANFTAVHATHLSEAEVGALGASSAFVCLCRTTERDLGDGLPPVGPLLEAGAALCTGADSHAISDPFEEARAIELDERSRVRRRHAAADATTLLAATSSSGYGSIGMKGLEAEDEVILDGTTPSLCDADDQMLDDAVVFAAHPGAVREVRVGGRAIVLSGVHVDYDEIRRDYLAALGPLV